MNDISRPPSPPPPVEPSAASPLFFIEEQLFFVQHLADVARRQAQLGDLAGLNHSFRRIVQYVKVVIPT